MSLWIKFLRAGRKRPYGSNPIDPDTDGGTVNDGDEVGSGRDPTELRDDVDPKYCCCPADGGDMVPYYDVTSTYAADTWIAICKKVLQGFACGSGVYRAFRTIYNDYVHEDSADSSYVEEGCSCGCYKNAEGYEGNDGASNSPVGTGETNAAEQEGSGEDRSGGDASKKSNKK